MMSACYAFVVTYSTSIFLVCQTLAKWYRPLTEPVFPTDAPSTVSGGELTPRGQRQRLMVSDHCTPFPPPKHDASACVMGVSVTFPAMTVSCRSGALNVCGLNVLAVYAVCVSLSLTPFGVPSCEATHNYTI